MSYGGLEVEFERRTKKEASLLARILGTGALLGVGGTVGYQLGKSKDKSDRTTDALLGAGVGGLGTAYLLSDPSSAAYSTGSPTQEYTYEEFDDIFK